MIYNLVWYFSGRRSAAQVHTATTSVCSDEDKIRAQLRLDVTEFRFKVTMETGHVTEFRFKVTMDTGHVTEFRFKVTMDTGHVTEFQGNHGDRSREGRLAFTDALYQKLIHQFNDIS